VVARRSAHRVAGDSQKTVQLYGRASYLWHDSAFEGIGRWRRSSQEVRPARFRTAALPRASPGPNHARPLAAVRSSAVSVVIVVPWQQQPWFLSGRAFHMLLEAASDLDLDPSDAEQLAKGEANNGLFLDQMEESQRTRLVHTLTRAALRLRLEVLHQADQDPWALSFAENLSTMQTWLTESV
jgi:hypothetical protein